MIDYDKSLSITHDFSICLVFLSPVSSFRRRLTTLQHHRTALSAVPERSPAAGRLTSLLEEIGGSTMDRKGSL